MARIIFAASGGQEWGSKIFEEWSRQFSITNERASRTWALMVNLPPTRSGGAIALFSKATNDYGWKGEWVFPNAPKVDYVPTGMIARMIQTQEQVPEKVGQQNALMSDEQGQVPFPPPIGEGIIAMAKHRASLMEPNVRELAANQRVLQYLTEVDDYPAGLVRYRKPPRMLVKEFLVEGGITIIYGPPKTGKTLVSLELAYCVVTGTDFFGRRIKEPAGVLYISAEGAELNSRRFQARTFKPSVALIVAPISAGRRKSA